MTPQGQPARCQYCGQMYENSQENCPRCNGPREIPLEAVIAWKKIDLVDEGVKEATRRSDACTHETCRFHGIEIRHPGMMFRVLILRTCTINWLRAEYPEDENMEIVVDGDY